MVRTTSRPWSKENPSHTTEQHQDDKRALEQIDALMFTGDPAEWPERWEELNWYVERWRERLKECK